MNALRRQSPPSVGPRQRDTTYQSRTLAALGAVGTAHTKPSARAEEWQQGF
jgi:hypothetical protein